MKSYDTFTTVQPQGDICVPGVPFAPGTEVEVSIVPKRRSPGDFVESWNRVVEELRRSLGSREITDDEIQREINDYRASR